MSMPGFAAEFALYTSDKSYRRTRSGRRDLVGQTVTPQKITCADYECGQWGQIPIWCVRCDSDRLM
jgi:hypothetical protein